MESLIAVAGQLSLPRLSPYLLACAGDLEGALRLYSWNLRVSAAFFMDVSTLEVALRNTIDRQLRSTYHREDSDQPWYQQVHFGSEGAAQVERAQSQALRRGRSLATQNDVIAQLTFGFWKSLLSKRYQAHLWPILRPAFLANGQPPPRREYVYSIVDQMSFLRNRIAHHEPIFSRDMAHQHELLIQCVGMMCQDTMKWVTAQNETSSIISQKPVILGDT